MNVLPSQQYQKPAIPSLKQILHILQPYLLTPWS